MSTDDAQATVTAEIGYLRSVGTAARSAPEGFDIPVLMDRFLHAVDALDAALKHHQSRQLYQMVENAAGDTICGHSEDYDGDLHFEGDDEIWYCKAKTVATVCASCADEDELWVVWPCLTYADITSALLGKETGDAER